MKKSVCGNDSIKQSFSTPNSVQVSFVRMNSFLFSNEHYINENVSNYFLLFIYKQNENRTPNLLAKLVSKSILAVQQAPKQTISSNSHTIDIISMPLSSQTSLIQTSAANATSQTIQNPTAQVPVSCEGISQENCSSAANSNVSFVEFILH